MSPLFALVLALSTQPEIASSPEGDAPIEGPAAVEAAPDLRFEFVAGLDELGAALPLFRNLRGAARVAVFVRGRELGVPPGPGLGVRPPLRPRAGPGYDRLTRIVADEATLFGLALGRLTLELWTPAGEDAKTRVHLTARGGVAEVDLDAETGLELDPATSALRWRPGPIDGRLAVRGLDLARCTKVHRFLTLGGRVDLALDLSGSADRPVIEARFTARALEWQGEVAGGIDATWIHGREGPDLSDLAIAWTAPSGPPAKLHLRAPLVVDLAAPDVTWKDGEPTALELDAPGLTPARLRPLWRAPARLGFSLDLSARASGTLDRPKLEADLAGTLSVGTTTTATIAPPAGVPVRAHLAGDGARQRLRFELGATPGVAATASTALDLDLTTHVPLAAVRRTGRSLVGVPLAGRLLLALPLPLVEPFLPFGIDRPEGRLEGDVKLGGTLGHPTFDGRVEGRAIALTPVALHRRLREVALAGVFSGDSLRLEAFRASGRPGELRGEGTLRFVATPTSAVDGDALYGRWRVDTELSVDLDGFPFVQPGFPLGRLTGGLRITGRASPGDLQLRVHVSPSDLVLTDEELRRARTVPQNRGVRFVDARGVERAESVLAGLGHLRLEVDTERPLHVAGDALAIDVGGKLVLDRRGPRVEVDGGFDVVRGGRFLLFGNPFELRAGRVTLAEGHLDRPVEAGPDAPALADPDTPVPAAPLDVVVDVVARGLVVDTHVVTRVKGPLHRPELVLLSSPALPEYQILALLIVGRVDAVDDHGGEVRRQAAELVERFHNPSLDRQIFDRLGVDKIGLGFGASVMNPIVSVGKQINRQLFVEVTYHHNAPPDANGREGHVEYRLDPHFTLDTVFGDAAEGSFALSYGTSFGGEPPPPAPGDDWQLPKPATTRPDRDGDGIPDVFDLCPDEPEDHDGFEDDDGCPDPDDDRDGVPDVKDGAPNEPETFNGFEDDDGVPDVAPERRIALAGLVRTIPFARGSARLGPEELRRLALVGAILRPMQSVAVEVVGHSDEKGTPAGNQRTSELRAKAVVDALRRAGIDGARITSAGRGASEPMDPADTDEARAKNRRVELRLSAAAE